jgi:hypothetical protein
MKLNITLAFSFLISGLFCLTSCQKDANSRENAFSPTTTIEFNDYWYAGTAEIDAYNLKQARYGEIHEGKAVLIFVTEPFSKSKQVKLDNGDEAGNDKQVVMKLNFTKNFTTGIYPYSMMMSSFTPVELQKFPHTPKVSMSSQEWCGNVFAQMNLKEDKYSLSSYSYFEQEGDVKVDIEKAFLEDEIWNRIRLDYKSLPVGDIEIIPGLFYSRLLHKNMKPTRANAELKENAFNAEYILNYPEQKRTLSIQFETVFPYKILSWEETFIDFGGKSITTSARLDRTIKTNYWTKHGNADSYLRDSLNLQ